MQLQQRGEAADGRDLRPEVGADDVRTDYDLAHHVLGRSGVASPVRRETLEKIRAVDRTVLVSVDRQMTDNCDSSYARFAK
jgi:hypothetical protein